MATIVDATVKAQAFTAPLIDAVSALKAFRPFHVKLLLLHFNQEVRRSKKDQNGCFGGNVARTSALSGLLVFRCSGWNPPAMTVSAKRRAPPFGISLFRTLFFIVNNYNSTGRSIRIMFDFSSFFKISFIYK